MVSTLKKNGLFFACVFILLGHFFLSPKDNTIDHSREVSISTSIDALEDGFPLFVSNRHIYASLARISSEYAQLYDEHPKFEPIETTWEDPGYFYWIYYLGQAKKFLFNGRIHFSDLHWIQFGAIFLCVIFAYLVGKLVSPKLHVALLAQIGFLLVTGNLHYSLVSHFAYAVVALYLIYLLVIFSYLWQAMAGAPLAQRHLAGFLIAGILFPVFIMQIRSDCGTIALFSYLLALVGLVLRHFILRKAPSWRVWAAILSLILIVLAIPVGLRGMARTHRQKLHPLSQENIQAFVGGHPLWISIYTGFGYIPNALGFKVSDEDAIQAVMKADGLVPYMTRAFEESLRGVVLQRVKNQPSILVKSAGVKIFDLARVRHATIPINGIRGFFDPLVLLALAQVFISLWIFRRRIFLDRIYYTGFSFFLLLAMVPVLIREPYMPYSSLFNNLLFMHILFIAVLFWLKRGQVGDSAVLRSAITDFSTDELNLA